ncbi:transmembrane glycoprotein, putative [Talaromyces stipitatus ATCC 10500]|uniref:Transmembrane glycoprotein, putative n=1 Tax=Talaromyces stipitatus (strain ATCC 10500 / CBS 375.48 / QM 6759 / NRRL 1006) TaxID=441959 RepID=B8LVD0_TALSN|nr:transmembrane glycoprotein, putative [Talaromyces stipitatus ATCC 10500]EED23949.1 transmembrane glycoprotein, putative [Talaromyces stipitatus ATCC 10500]
MEVIFFRETHLIQQALFLISTVHSHHSQDLPSLNSDTLANKSPRKKKMEVCLEIADLHSSSRSEALEILTKIARIEKRTFPTNEAFEFDIKLWKKSNTRVLYATTTKAHSDNDNGGPRGDNVVVVAYLVYVRHRNIALLHKLCVVDAYRRKGIGERLLVHAIKERLVNNEPGCEYIQLWVDKARVPARSLYTKCGFEEKEEVPDYYAKGRTGILYTYLEVEHIMAFSTTMASKLAVMLLLMLANIVDAIPTPNYPINSQLPPVARVSQPFNFTFSGGTFINSGTGLQYSLSNAPSWLKVDTTSQTLYGTPSTNDAGAPQFLLVAADQSGSASMSVTLVVSSESGPRTGKSLLPQLAKSGSTSGPATVFMHPGQAFTINFDPKEIFANTQANTVYYATSAPYNAPLPSWISFDPSNNLKFTGNSPSNPSSVPQSFSFNLIASDAAGFSAAMVTFEIVVSQHILSFGQTAQTLNFTRGQPFSTPHFIDDLSLDNHSVTAKNLSHFSVDGPSWLKLDNDTLSLSGIVPNDADNQNITITVGDIYDDNAKLELYLRVSQLFAKGVESCNATIGEKFSYSFDKSLLSDDSVQLRVDLGAASSWAHYDLATKMISGDVPKDLTPQTFPIKLTATQGSIEETRNLNLSVFRSGKTGVVSDNQTSSGTNHGTSRRKAGIIAAAVLLPVALLTAAGIFIFVCCRRRRSRIDGTKHKDEENPAGDTHSGPVTHPEKNMETEVAEMSRSLSNSSGSSNDSAPPQLELDPLWETASLEDEQQQRHAQSPSVSVQPQNFVMDWDNSIMGTEKIQASPNVSPTRSTSVSQTSPFTRRSSRRYSKREPLKSIQARSIKRDSIMSSKSKRYSRRLSGISATGLPVRLSGAGHGAGGFGPLRTDVVGGSWYTTQVSLQSDDTSIENLATMFPRPPHVRNRDGSLSMRHRDYQKRASMRSNRPLSTEPPEPDSLEAFIQGRARNRNSGNPYFSARMNSSGSTGYRALEKARRSSSIAETTVSTSTFADDRQQHPVRPVSTISASIYEDDNRNSVIQARPMSQISEVGAFPVNRNRTSQGLVQRYTEAIAELPRFWSQTSMRSAKPFESGESLTGSDDYYNLIDELENPEGGRQWYRVNSQTQQQSNTEEVTKADSIRQSAELSPISDAGGSRVRRMSLLRTGCQDSSPTAVRHWRLANTLERRPSIEGSDSLQPTANSSFRGDLAFV